MTDITDQQLATLWRSSVSLSKAWETFAHPTRLERWKAAKSRSKMKAFEDAAPAAGESEQGILGVLSNALIPVAEIAKEQETVRAEMRVALIGFVRQGHLFAYGYEPPRKLASQPVALPLAVWSGRIDWSESRVSYAGLIFEQVRITTKRIRNEILERPNVVASPNTPKVGRPGVGPEIEVVCRQMIAEGLIDPSHSQKSYFPMIRERLDRKFPNLSVPAGHIKDQTIRNYFSPIFKELPEVKKL